MLGRERRQVEGRGGGEHGLSPSRGKRGSHANVEVARYVLFARRLSNRHGGLRLKDGTRAAGNFRN